jgi:serine/threonine protein kinase
VRRFTLFDTECILSAIRYVSHHGVVHRDLKFEICLNPKTPAATRIKIGDLGLSKVSVSRLHDGTGRYHLYHGTSAAACTVKPTCGALTLLKDALSASKPLYHKRRRVVIDYIMRGKYDFEVNTGIYF